MEYVREIQTVLTLTALKEGIISAPFSTLPLLKYAKQLWGWFQMRHVCSILDHQQSKQDCSIISIPFVTVMYAEQSCLSASWDFRGTHTCKIYELTLPSMTVPCAFVVVVGLVRSGGAICLALLRGNTLLTYQHSDIIDCIQKLVFRTFKIGKIQRDFKMA